MKTADARRLPLLVTVALTATLLLAACQPGASSVSPTGSTSPSTQPTASASSPAGSSSSEPTASAAESLGPFTCSLPVAGTATIDRAQITDVRVAGHDGYDRIVFEFAAGLPEYSIASATPPFTRDPSGLPLAVAGSAFLSLVMQGGTAVTPEGTLTYSGPTDFSPALTTVSQLVEAGDFEAVSSWYVGLSGTSCIRVLTLSNPSRLVIDIEH